MKFNQYCEKSDITHHFVQVKISTATTLEGNTHAGKLHGERTIIKCTVILTQQTAGDVFQRHASGDFSFPAINFEDVDETNFAEAMLNEETSRPAIYSKFGKDRSPYFLTNKLVQLGNFDDMDTVFAPLSFLMPKADYLLLTSKTSVEDLSWQLVV